jgi:uncharacterized membrane protein
MLIRGTVAAQTGAVNSVNVRLLASAAVGAALGLATASAAAWQIAVLTGWCAGSAAFLVQVAREIAGCDPGETKALATREDVSHVLADVTLLTAAGASLIGVGFVLMKAGESGGTRRAAVAGIGALSVALGWITLQTIFLLRYAREYYNEADGGIDFGGDAPDYHDFAYFAFGIGMTYQVADTAVTDRVIRRTVLRHALASFLFATSFIAVLINVVGGLL